MKFNKLREKLRKYSAYAVWAATIWVTVAFLGYGLALRSFAMKGLKESHVNYVGPVNGKIQSVTSTAARQLGFHLKLEKLPMTFHIPPEYVKNEEAWADLEKYLVPGAIVWFKPSPEDYLILQLRVRRAFDEKELISFEHVFQAQKALPDAVAARGMRFVLFALAIPPLVFFIRRSVRGRRRSEAV
ncbi:MAG: hypothetical protein NDJ89_18300 [Oligoflexia bacterium]|nr:hypothetical protein [Oligoflexia bacterium]